MRRHVELVVTVCVGLLVGASWLEVSCTEGTTPDCTGDAALSCGPLPNEGGTDDGSSEGGGEGGATDASQNTMDGTMITVDAGDTDAGDDSGLLDLDADAGD